MNMSSIMEQVITAMIISVLSGLLSFTRAVITSESFAQGCRTVGFIAIKLILAPVIGFFLAAISAFALGFIGVADLDSTVSLVLIAVWTIAAWNWLSKKLR